MSRRRITVDGNEAAASVAYRAIETIAIFPITPSSPMAELCDEWSSKKLPNLWCAVPEVAEQLCARAAERAGSRRVPRASQPDQGSRPASGDGVAHGVTPGGWIGYSELLEQAGADGLELQIFHAASDMTSSAADVERQTVENLGEVKRSVRVPVAVKLAPLLTAFAHFAKALDAAGADGLGLFTRFHRVDIDVDELVVVRTLPLSDSSELSPRLRRTAALAGRVNASIAVSGGVHTALDVVKATMAGAHATQMVSALLRNGALHVRTVLRDLEAWMAEHEWMSLADMRGNMSFERIPDPAAYERENFRMALR
jgi:Dihydroorotate dehydrogenase